MDLDHLRTFIAVAEVESFRAAAVMLGLRQPTVSRHVLALEERLHTNLFERRRGRGVRLTNAGRSFLVRARRVIAELDEGVREATLAGEAAVGAVSVGIFTSLHGGPLRVAMAGFLAAAPEVRLCFVESSPSDLLAALRAGRIELAVVVSEAPPAAGVVAVPLWSERLVAALSATSPLSTRGP